VGCVERRLAPSRDIGGIEDASSRGSESSDVTKRCLSQLEIVAVCVDLIRAATVLSSLLCVVVVKNPKPWNPIASKIGVG
jgi:hypothetical protein